VLAETFDSVCTIEIVSSLARSARERLARLGYRSVQVRDGDGYAGWPERAPFDAILVTAAAPEIPAPLLDQLAEGGRLIMPVGSPWAVQNLVVVERHNGRLHRRTVFPVRFVPLTRSDSTRRVPEVR
jgi:protein-L-isoaspartate(D-aspartate) O-methyltransferase